MTIALKLDILNMLEFLTRIRLFIFHSFYNLVLKYKNPREIISFKFIE